MSKTFKDYLTEAEDTAMEETYDGDDFYLNYGDMWYNEDENLDTSTPKKIGRNDPCPCGSGKKYKQCHGGAA